MPFSYFSAIIMADSMCKSCIEGFVYPIWVICDPSESEDFVLLRCF